MSIPLTHAGVLVLVVVGGVVGVASVADLGAGGEPLTANQTEEHRSSAADVAFEVTTTLANGDAADVTRSIELVVGAGDERSAVDRRTVTVPGEGSERVTFSAPTEAVTPGEHEYAIVTDDGTELAAGNVTLNPPTFTVADARAERVVRGETGTVTATVRNRGDFRGMRSVDLLFDADRDGSYGDGETVATTAKLIRAGEEAETTFAVETDGLDPGTYAFRVAGTEDGATGTLTVLRPATVRVTETAMTTDAVRGDRFEGSVTLVNRGDVAGTETVGLEGPTEAFDRNRTVTLDGGESTTVAFNVSTANVTRGNHSIGLAVGDESTSGTLRVREGFFKVSDLDGPDSPEADEELRFAATVRNIGDATANQTVEHRIDLDGDDDPETVLANRSVALAPGNRTTVEFAVSADDRDGLDEDDLVGTHVHGVYSEDTEVTGVVVVRAVSYGGVSSGSASDTGGDEAGESEPETVSKDVITQEKYGLDYDEVSSETQSQVDELHERQPFADGLVITEVLTREEIARQEYGLDVERNDDFDFTSIEMEYQQKIEAEFDAQFQSDDGDRIDSWDELAREQFDSEYEALNESQQETIRERYDEQFE